MNGNRTRGSATGSADRVDEQAKETFPASDPPDNTPPPGSRKAEREAHRGRAPVSTAEQGKAQPASAHISPEHASAGDQASRARDPHGAGPAEASREDKPKGTPTSDRHDTETVVGG